MIKKIKNVGKMNEKNKKNISYIILIILAILLIFNGILYRINMDKLESEFVPEEINCYDIYNNEIIGVTCESHFVEPVSILTIIILINSILLVVFGLINYFKYNYK